VLSARGDTILAEDSDGDGSASITGARASIEDRMEHNIEQMLSARVGAGNVRAQVSVDLDTTRQVVTQQSFNPDQQVVRSTSSRDEKAQNSENNGQVGVTANLPPALAGPGTSNGTTDASTKTNENVTYEIGNTRSQTTTEPGAIKRISVAVLVNGIYDVGKSGQVDYQPRSPEEIKRLTDLVKSAVGYDQARGDTVSVDSLRFMDYSMDVGEPVGPTVMQRLSNNIIPILRWIIGLAIVALALFFGVRPVVAKVLDAPQPLPPAPRAEALAGPEREEAPASGQPPVSTPAGATVAPVARTIPPRGGVQKLQPYSAEGEAEADTFINQLAGQGSGLKRRVEVVRRLVDEDPNEAMKVLRGWLAAEAEAR
ncbi:flagellar M-ring protein FliF, partial [Thioclava sp. BHET1]